MVSSYDVNPGHVAFGESDRELTSLTIAQAAKMIRERAVTPSQLTAAALRRIAKCDPQINSFITVCGEDAMAQARALDHEQAAGCSRGPLFGIPIALKDNIDAVGIPTTAGSAVLKNHIPNHDAEVTRRLRAAGAVILGKVNLHEFAAGGTGHVSAYGATHNPWDLTRVPGGSSSGSGAAVAARLCFAALGTDTGGSIRIPSSWCGLTGIKPTYGLVSIRGIVPLIYSLDHCGPMARSAEDAAILLTVLAGYDLHDGASVEHPGEDYVAALSQPIKAFRLGAPSEFYADLDPEVERAVAQASRLLQSLTAGIVSRQPLPPCGDFLPFLAETHSYHEQYEANGLHLYQTDTETFLTKMPPPTTSQYVRARDSLRVLRKTIDAAFADQDLIILPTERMLPFTIAEAVASSERARDMDGIAPQQWATVANTYQFNLYGLPALTLPCGFSESGLPIGLTIAGPRFSEGKILALAAAYQQQTDWHLRQPPSLS